MIRTALLASTAILIVCAPASAQTAAPAAAAPALAQSGAPAPASASVSGAAASIQPARPIEIFVPLTRNRSVLGDVTVRLDPAGQPSFRRTDIVEHVSRLLRAEARGPFAAALGTSEYVTSQEIAAAGVNVEFDPALLEVAVAEVQTAMLAPQSLLELPEPRQEPITAEPEEFSAFLTGTADILIDEFDSVGNPNLFLFGAARFRNLVAEFDGGYLGDSIVGNEGFYRRQARLIYDQPQLNRRFSAGDLRIEALALTGVQFLAGAAVEKRRRIFNPFQPLTAFGNQQFLLDRSATVDIVVNGRQERSLQLNPGTYDLSALARQFGSNNIQLFITDASGRRQIAGVDFFFDPIQLAPGEEEYSLAIGLPIERFELEPEYGEDPALFGYYRRGLNNRLVVGGAIQLSQEQQVLEAEVRFTPRSLPGRFELAVAGSIGESSGFATRVAWFWASQGNTRRQVSIAVDYEGGGFVPLGRPFSITDVQSVNVSANYSQALSPRADLVTGLSYFSREDFEARALFFADIIYRLSPRLRLTGGIEYAQGGDNEGVGVRIGISALFGRRHRVDASYRTAQDFFNLSYAKDYDDRVGALGYGGSITSADGAASTDAFVNYIGNRFEGRITHTTAGNGFDQIFEANGTRIQLSSSLAVAGGSVAIGRPIRDSFAIVERHPGIRNEQVIVGDNLADGEFLAQTDFLGPAVHPSLSSYTRQTIIYDLKNAAAGVDIGEGIETIEPPFHSGYRIQVGTDASVSATGTLTINGAPANLITGQVVAVNDEDFEPETFFTNSVGRFAVLGLRPGKRYRVQLTSGQSFLIEVPADTQGLFRLPAINLSIPTQR